MSRLPDYTFAGGTAVVTGAASGIGEQLAHQLGARGSNLVLVDRDAERLDSAAESVRRRSPGVSVDAVAADLHDTDGLWELATGILARHPRITLLVNNAGVALGGQFEQLTLEDFDYVMRINFDAPVRLTHHFLPSLLESPGSHIVNVSSLYGLISPPGQSAYSASKFALRGFSQVLRLELARSQVGVTTVHPGGIRTRIAESARMGAKVTDAQRERGLAAARRMLSYPPEKAAAQILDGVEKRRARVLIAASAKVPDLLARIAPVGHTALLQRLFR